MNKKTIIINFFSLLLFMSITTFGQVVINEYSASNLTGYLDNYQKTEDWIELYNTSSSTIDISGYYLSDDVDFLTQWQIPSGTTIAANGFKTFWCSGRDEVVGNNYHTNFKLKQTKNNPESVILSDASGAMINQFELQVTQVEHSMGRESNGSSTWKVFTNPTKGSSNNGTSYTNYAEAPIMDMDAGFYSGSVTVTLTTADPNCTIKYTTNGDKPTASSQTYTTPITVNSTKVITAYCVSSDAQVLPSKLTFNTYFIDVNHTLPVLSTSGTAMQTLINGNELLKPHGSFEYFEDGVRKDFGYGEYNKHGQDSWSQDQRSYDYIARDEMGYQDAIHQKLLSLSDRNKFQRIIIRASGDDNYPARINGQVNAIAGSAHMRDLFVQKLANKHHLSLDMRRGERCVSYINGDYWGVYSIREKVADADATNYYHNQDKYHVNYLMDWSFTWAKYGGQRAFDDWEVTKNSILFNDMSVQSNYETAMEQYDYKSLVDYVLINSFVVCTDWVNWNVGWWRGLNPEGTHTKWGYTLWDEDATFNHYINYTGVPDVTANATACFQEGINEDPTDLIAILNKLMDNEEFLQYYVSRYQDLKNTAFQTDEMISVLETIENAIAPEMPGHIARWGGNITEWENNVQTIKDFITDRNVVLPGALNGCYNLTGPYDINVLVEPVGAGNVMFNSLDLTTVGYPWSASYHGGMEMKIKAIENNSNFVFDHWEVNNNTVLPNVNVKDIVISLTQNDEIKAVFSPSNGGTPIVINEINYNSNNTFDTGDWVELYNNGDVEIDLSGWDFKDSDDTHEFIIPNGTVLAAGEYLVLAQTLADFQALFPSVTNVIGDFTFGLSGGGELIRLFDNNQALIDEVEYDDATPWPTAADGDGPTLELINPNFDNALAASWQASIVSVAPNGTPGAINSNTTAGINDNIVNIGMVLYPNPMDEQAIIKINNDYLISDGLLKITDLLGRTIQNKKFKTNQVTILKDKLSSGIYLVEIFDNKQLIGTKKLIVK